MLRWQRGGGPGQGRRRSGRATARKLFNRVRRAARVLVQGERLPWPDGPHCGTAELVARQHDDGGYGRLDLFVLYLAIQESHGESEGGIALLEKLLRRDPDQRKGELALLAVSRRQSLAGAFFLPTQPVIQQDMRLASHLTAVALAVHAGEPRVRVATWHPRSSPRYDRQWFRDNGFTGKEIDRLEAVQGEVYRRLDLAPIAWNELSRIQQELRGHIDPSDRMHGRGDFYQTCEPLLIRGQRPTGLRFDAYGLASVLEPSDRVLDIGCNCGFLALHAARHARAVDGFDVNPRFIAIANRARHHLGRHNCRFTQASFDDFQPDRPYDMVFSFAVHHWIGLPIPAYGARLQRLVRPGGLVLVESQDLSTHDSDWDDKLAALCSVGFEEVRSGTLCDDGILARRHVLLRDTRTV